MEIEDKQFQAKIIIICGACLAILIFLLLVKIGGEPFGDRTIFGLFKAVPQNRRDFREMQKKRRKFSEEERKWRQKFRRRPPGRMRLIVDFDQRPIPKKFRDRFWIRHWEQTLNVCTKIYIGANHFLTLLINKSPYTAAQLLIANISWLLTHKRSWTVFHVSWCFYCTRQANPKYRPLRLIFDIWKCTKCDIKTQLHSMTDIRTHGQTGGQTLPNVLSLLLPSR